MHLRASRHNQFAKLPNSLVIPYAAISSVYMLLGLAGVCSLSVHKWPHFYEVHALNEVCQGTFGGYLLRCMHDNKI